MATSSTGPLGPPSNVRSRSMKTAPAPPSGSIRLVEVDVGAAFGAAAAGRVVGAFFVDGAFILGVGIPGVGILGVGILGVGILGVLGILGAFDLRPTRVHADTLSPGLWIAAGRARGPDAAKGPGGERGPFASTRQELEGGRPGSCGLHPFCAPAHRSVKQ